MHVWMPTNKMWVLARPAKNGNTADSLKRGREHFEQATARTAEPADASRRVSSGHARDAGAKRRRTGVPSDAVLEPAVSPTGSARPFPQPSPSNVPPASLPPPGPWHAAGAVDSRAVQSNMAAPESPGTAQAGSSSDADDAKPQAGSAKQAALRVAVAAGDRESERYTGFELVEELTQEQLAEAAEELYEPLPTCPICALLPICIRAMCAGTVRTAAFLCRHSSAAAFRHKNSTFGVSEMSPAQQHEQC